MEHARPQRLHPPRRSTYRSGARRGALALCCGLAAALTPAGRARAAAGQWQAGARLGAAWLERAGGGPCGELFLRRGIGDALDLDVSVVSSFHPFQSDAKLAASTGAPTGWALGITPGVIYRWDVLRVIPFAGAAVGIYASDGWIERESDLQFGAAGRVGLDYLLSRDVVLSAQASAHFALTESPMPSPWLQLTVGAAYAWGW